MIFLSIILLLSFLVTIFSSFATKLLAVGFDEKTITIAAPYVAINFYYLPLIFAVTFFSTLLQYKHYFGVTAFSTGLLNITLIAALYLSKGSPQAVIVTYLSWGVIAGGVLQLAVHIWAVHKLGFSKMLLGGLKYFKRKSLHVKAETAQFRQQFLPAMWGNSGAQFSSFLDTWLASFLISGSISYLYYANRIFQLPLALFAIATSIAIFPRISKFIKNIEEHKALLYMQKAFWFLAYILTLSTLFGFILSDEIIKIFFERGAFTSQDAQTTSLVLKM